MLHVTTPGSVRKHRALQFFGAVKGLKKRVTGSSGSPCFKCVGFSIGAAKIKC